MSITLTATAGTAEVRLVVSSSTPGAVRVEVLRTMTARTSPVRAWPVFGGLWTHQDVDVLFGTPLRYTATVYGADGTALETSETVEAMVQNPGAMIRDALVPSRRAPLQLVGIAAGDSTTDVRRELLYPQGRSAPIAITDVRQRAVGSTTAVTRTAGEEDVLRRLLDSGNVMLFTGPADFDVRWPLYVSLGTVTTSRVSARQDEARLWSMDWVEVDAPPLAAPQPGRTWRALLERGTRWRDIYRTPWGEVLYPPEPLRTER